MGELTQNFSIFYDADNDSLNEHSINARQIGEAITGMAELVEQSDKILNGENSEIKLNVVAKKAGSFGVEFEVFQVLNHAVDVLKYLGLSAAGGALLGGPVFSLARRLNKRKIVGTVTHKKDGTTTLKLDDENIIVDENVAKLVINPLIRSALNKVVQKPLEGRSNPVFKLEHDGVEIVRLEGEDTAKYEPLPRHSLVETEVDEKEVNVRFTQVNFDAQTGWKIDWNGESKGVKLEDQAFIERVSSNQAKFSKDDLFVVKLQVKKTSSALAGEKTTLKITKVIRHRVEKNRKLI